MAGTRKTPMRRCVGCGESKDKRDLMRIVRTEEGVFADPTGKKNGRGAYLCPKSECLEKALKTHALSRALKTEVPEADLTAIRELWSQYNG